jgi:hypothetical protein
VKEKCIWQEEGPVLNWYLKMKEEKKTGEIKPDRKSKRAFLFCLRVWWTSSGLYLFLNQITRPFLYIYHLRLLFGGYINSLYLRASWGPPVSHSIYCDSIKQGFLRFNTGNRGRFTFLNQLIGLLPILCGSLTFLLKKKEARITVLFY